MTANLEALTVGDRVRIVVDGEDLEGIVRVDRGEFIDVELSWLETATREQCTLIQRNAERPTLTPNQFAALALQLDEREQGHVARTLEECIDARAVLRAIAEARRVGDLHHALVILAEWETSLSGEHALEVNADRGAS